MARHSRWTVSVQFGDCDPAGIVFFPNFSRWMDAASLAFFVDCGVPPWRELVKTRGIVGTPLLEIHTRFYVAATRAFVMRDAADADRLRAIPVPDDIRALCE